MRYRVVMDRLVNRLTPHFLRNRRFVLWVQSLISPLQRLNLDFELMARERSIEAVMTSQTLYFSWFLNYRLSKYFEDRNDRIEIEHSVDVGVDLYQEHDVNGRPFTVWYESAETSGVEGTEEAPRCFFYRSESVSLNESSFSILVPRLRIEQGRFVPLLVSLVEAYRLAGKTYHIKIMTE